jgi:hypothetical protein
MARYEIGKRAEARDADRFAFQVANARNRRGRKERSLSLVILAADHDEVGAGQIGINHGAGCGVKDIHVAAEQRLHGRRAGADKEQFHVGAVLPIQAGVVSEPKNRKGSGEGGVGNAELLSVQSSGIHQRKYLENRNSETELQFAAWPHRNTSRCPGRFPIDHVLDRAVKFPHVLFPTRSAFVKTKQNPAPSFRARVQSEPARALSPP